MDENTDNIIPEKREGLARILAAFSYSCNGLKDTFICEQAFRQELILTCVLVPVAFFCPFSLSFKAFLIGVNFLVLIVELLNSSVEAIVDGVFPGYNIYAKRAKDMASAAVLLSLILLAFVWILAFIRLSQVM